jgi:hypothetical protein
VLPDRGYGLVFSSGPDEFIVAGTDIQVTFTPSTPGPSVVGLSKVEEGTFLQGKWVAGRWLNGDDTQLLYDLSALASQSLSGEGVSFPAGDPTIRRVQLYRYP